MASAALPQNVKLAAFHIALNCQAIDLRSLRQVPLQFRRKSHPVCVPLCLCLVSVMGSGQFWIGWYVTAVVAFAAPTCQVCSQYGVIRRERPERVPAVLRLIKRDAASIKSIDRAQPRADIDMCFVAEVVQQRIQARILIQGLDERADCVERRRIHLLFQVLKEPGSEARVDPTPIVIEVKIRLANQEIIRTKPLEGGQPAFRCCKISSEHRDVW